MSVFYNKIDNTFKKISTKYHPRKKCKLKSCLLLQKQLHQRINNLKLITTIAFSYNKLASSLYTHAKHLK